MYNSFDTDIAVDVGINAAILYRNIQLWCEYNRTNDKNFYDGYYWTFNSTRAFAEQFPYLSEKQIRTALSLLEEKGYIKTGNYNIKGYDRTKWYADLQQGNSILPVGQMELTCGANGIDTEDEPIPYNYTNNKPNNDITPIIPAEIAKRKDLFEQFWAAYPKCKRKVDKKGCERKFIKIENLETIFPDIMASLEMWKKSKQWTKDNGEYIPLTSKWINQEYWTVTDERTERQVVADQLLAQNMSKFFGG